MIVVNILNDEIFYFILRLLSRSFLSGWSFLMAAIVIRTPEDAIAPNMECDVEKMRVISPIITKNAWTSVNYPGAVLLRIKHFLNNGVVCWKGTDSVL